MNAGSCKQLENFSGLDIESIYRGISIYISVDLILVAERVSKNNITSSHQLCPLLVLVDKTTVKSSGP